MWYYVTTSTVRYQGNTLTKSKRLFHFQQMVYFRACDKVLCLSVFTFATFKVSFKSFLKIFGEAVFFYYYVLLLCFSLELIKPFFLTFGSINLIPPPPFFKPVYTHFSATTLSQLILNHVYYWITWQRSSQIWSCIWKKQLDSEIFKKK